MENSLSVEQVRFSEKKIEQTATKLKTKYHKDRRVNEKKLLKPKNKFLKFISVFVSTLLVVLFFYSIIVCISTFKNRLDKTAPTFAGYTFMQIQTGSMTAKNIVINGVTYESGFPIKSNIVVRSVNTDTLKIGDKIAFYPDSATYNEFYVTKRSQVTTYSSETKYSISVGQVFGFQPGEFKSAGKKGIQPVFHHIISIFEDENGVRWFKTRGSANGSADTWIIRENYIVGIYDSSSTAKILTTVLGFLTSSLGLFITILIPLVILIILIMWDSLKNIGIIKLELDCVEEKRKITDEICVKNNVGFKMSPKTKRKILVQAKEEDKMQYISLLWKKGEVPVSIQKYCLRRNIMLEPTKKLLEINRNCEQMLKDGISPTKIATYYLTEKAKVEQQEKEIREKLRTVKKMYAKKEGNN